MWRSLQVKSMVPTVLPFAVMDGARASTPRLTGDTATHIFVQALEVNQGEFQMIQWPACRCHGDVSEE
jgi:hypothetical protein